MSIFLNMHGRSLEMSVNPGDTLSGQGSPLASSSDSALSLDFADSIADAVA